jgi:hypothetical protein
MFGADRDVSGESCRMLNKLGKLGVLAGALLAASSCQCCRFTEPYNDFIDHVSDCPCRLDRFYHPKLDLTRINRADGWQCGRCRDVNCPEAAW